MECLLTTVTAPCADLLRHIITVQSERVDNGSAGSSLRFSYDYSNRINTRGNSEELKGCCSLEWCCAILDVPFNDLDASFTVRRQRILSKCFSKFKIALKVPRLTQQAFVATGIARRGIPERQLVPELWRASVLLEVYARVKLALERIKDGSVSMNGSFLPRLPLSTHGVDAERTQRGFCCSFAVIQQQKFAGTSDHSRQRASFFADFLQNSPFAARFHQRQQERFLIS